MKIQPSRTAVLKTFAYRDVFSYPLTCFECFHFLINDKAVSFEEFLKEVAALVESRIIDYSRPESLASPGYYFLTNSSFVNRDERLAFSKEKLEKAGRVAKLFSLIPTVRFVGVTGAVAAGNSPREDDIDFLIISSSQTLWLTRFLCVFLLKITGNYRTDESFASKVCPNIFVSEDALVWTRHKNIYTAHEILLMKPVFDRADYYFRFISENSWVFEFLPNMFASYDRSVFSSTPFVESTSFGERLFKRLNRLSMKFQLWYMRKRKTVEVTEANLIHFKKNDNLGWVLDSYEKRLKELNLS